MEPDTLDIVRTCPVCGKSNTVTVNIEDARKYEEGMSIQDAFPYLSPDDREIIITGICAGCWERFNNANMQQEY